MHHHLPSCASGEVSAQRQRAFKLRRALQTRRRGGAAAGVQRAAPATTRNCAARNAHADLGTLACFSGSRPPSTMRWKSSPPRAKSMTM
jgi:hypothetical protein